MSTTKSQQDQKSVEYVFEKSQKTTRDFSSSVGH